MLHREFLFRIVDRELLSTHAQGDMSKLLLQFAALLIFVSLVFAGVRVRSRMRRRSRCGFCWAWLNPIA